MKASFHRFIHCYILRNKWVVWVPVILCIAHKLLSFSPSSKTKEEIVQRFVRETLRGKGEVRIPGRGNSCKQQK